MRRKKCGVAHAGLWLVLAGIGCGGNAESSKPDAGRHCAQGEINSCIGIGGCQGTRLCLARGDAITGDYGQCVCDAPVAAADSGTSHDKGGIHGTGGMGGGAGTGSMNGAGGTTGPAMDASVTHPPDAGHDAQAQPVDSGAHVLEDCSNGVDDNGDGKIDCADDDCMAWTCMATAPDGWSGPAALYVGTNQTPMCGGSYTSETLRGGTAVNAPAATCSSCTCSPTMPGCASALDFAFGTQPDCSDAHTVAAIMPDNPSCVEVSSSYLSASPRYLQTQLPPNVTSCTPSTQSPTIPDPSFTNRVLACAASSALRRGGCSPGNACAPAAPFTGPFCIVKQGDLACPSGPYSDRRVYFSAIDDTRNCSACSCASDCSYTWKAFDDTDTSCQTPRVSSTNPGTCDMVTPSSSKIRVSATITGTGTCTASGGRPTGSAAGSSPVTACCLP